MGVKLFHADGQTDMTKLLVAFRNFADAPKEGKMGMNIFLMKKTGLGEMYGK